MYFLLILFMYNVFTTHNCLSSDSQQQSLTTIVKIICINKQQAQKYLDLNLQEATERDEIYRTIELLKHEQIALRHFTSCGTQAVSALCTTQPRRYESSPETTPIELNPRYAAIYWEAFNEASKAIQFRRSGNS